MKEWKECKILEIVISANTGLDAIKRAPIVIQNTGIKCLRIQDVSQRKKYDDWGFTTVENRNFEKFRLKKSDIILARTGGSIGVNLFIDYDLNSVFNNGLIRIRANEKLCDSKYLYYNFRTSNYNSFIESISGGTSTQPNMQINSLLSFPILLPPLAEQKAIAGVLSALDDKIDLLHRQNKTLESMAEALFRQWFVEEADESWEEGKLGDVIEFNPLRSLPKGSIAPYLEMSNVSSSSFHPENWYNREFSSGMKFRNGDTLLARITPCLENGKSCYVTFLESGQIGWGSTEYIVMRAKNGIHPLMTYALAINKDFRDYAEGCLEGSSGRQRVNLDHLKEFTILLPKSLSVFNENMETLEKKLHNNFLQIRSLEKLRDTLLPKLMGGEVRVGV
ncbi:MAG: restriction endonuclease subunit S [Leptospiraceae bacterium]|nr:restriction endonuclease subunit S [Leptospiraceae bacterium]